VIMGSRREWLERWECVNVKVYRFILTFSRGKGQSEGGKVVQRRRMWKGMMGKRHLIEKQRQVVTCE
jgi:hypothetical protein